MGMRAAMGMRMYWRRPRDMVLRVSYGAVIGGLFLLGFGVVRTGNSKNEIQGFFPFDKLRVRMTT